MEKTIVIIGASGHGKVVADIAKKTGYTKILFLDDNDQLLSCGGYPVAGQTADYKNYDCDMIVAIGNTEVRQRIQTELMKAGKHLATLIHPAAVVGENTAIGEGTVVMAGAVVNPGAVIGKGCIINTCASVDHDDVIENYVHISVGAHLAGNVHVGEGTWVGIGAVINNNITIVSGCMIGAGAVVIKNIMEKGTYIGVPAKRLG
ncbi:acetyltransferase [Lachnoclostridium sp. An298]|nr:acetyltransferase [Lachnoclostridium sp. An298]